MPTVIVNIIELKGGTIQGGGLTQSLQVTRVGILYISICQTRETAQIGKQWLDLDTFSK